MAGAICIWRGLGGIPDDLYSVYVPPRRLGVQLIAKWDERKERGGRSGYSGIYMSLRADLFSSANLRRLLAPCRLSFREMFTRWVSTVL